jgi:hypothetical protein
VNSRAAISDDGYCAGVAREISEPDRSNAAPCSQFLLSQTKKPLVFTRGSSKVAEPSFTMRDDDARRSNLPEVSDLLATIA